jgi:hypothetical protein
MTIPLTKVDEEKRLVYGRATQEILDKSGEILDYESSKPNFEAWSNDFATRTGNKSYGNIRQQHDSKKAIGKIAEPLSFDDKDKALDICVKVTDDSAWDLVKDNVLTGFSVGGSYGSKWKDDAGVLHYTAVPSEISLVDNPCVGTATIDFVKADGSVEHREIPKEGNSLNEDISKAVSDAFNKALGDNDLEKAFSYEEVRRRLNNAIENKMQNCNCGYFWIRDTYPDCVIVNSSFDSNMYRIGYTIDENGAIALGDMEQVAVQYVPITEADNSAAETVDKADDANELTKGEGDTVEKADNKQKKDENPVTTTDKKGSGKPEEKPEGESKEKPAEKAAGETLDAISLFMDELNKSAGAESNMDKLVKLSHTLNQMGAACKCDKCTGKTSKAADDADLHKADGMDSGDDSLAKAVSAIGDLKKAVEGLKATNEELKKQVEAVSNSPVPGGAVIAPGTMTMDKTVGTTADAKPAGVDETAVLRKMFDEEKDPMLKQAMSERLAVAAMKKVYSGSAE